MLPQHGTLELSRSRLQHNLRVLRAKIGAQKTLCATIKANAYGHGLDLISQLLREQSIGWVCVYSLREAFDVARSPMGHQFNILVLAPVVLPAPARLPDIPKNIRLNLTDALSARNLAASLAPRSDPVHVHIQIDAGLTRIGVEPHEAHDLAQTIAQLPNLHLEGLFAHFSHGDVPQHETVTHQLNLLQRAAAPVMQQFPSLLIHLQNSGGAWHLTPQDHASLHMVRIGIALYGLQPSTAAPIPELLPIAQVHAPILALHQRPPGTGVGYGHTFVTERHSTLAIVPVGYADGYPRALSNRSIAQLRGTDVPLVGRVSMDQVILDLTDLPGPPPQPGEPVTLISHDPAHENSLDNMADATGTIGYELATHFGERLNRVIVDEYHNATSEVICMSADIRDFADFAVEADKVVRPETVRVALDIGSRDGLMALLLKSKYGGANVYAFECNPEGIALCRSNLAKRPVTLVENAVTDVNGELDFYAIDPKKTRTPHADGNIGASSLFPANPAYPHETYVQNKIRVPATRIDAWAQSAGITTIDLVWMDVQGAALAALQGFGELLKTVRLIYVELEYQPMYVGQPLAGEVRNFLQTAGFKLHRRFYADDWFGNEMFVRA